MEIAFLVDGLIAEANQRANSNSESGKSKCFLAQRTGQDQNPRTGMSADRCNQLLAG